MALHMGNDVRLTSDADRIVYESGNHFSEILMDQATQYACLTQTHPGPIVITKEHVETIQKVLFERIKNAS